MKKILTKITAVLIAIFGIFVFAGCGDEFANAQQITKAEALHYAETYEESYEQLAQGYKMTATEKFDGMDASIEMQLLTDQSFNVTGLALTMRGNINNEALNAKVYVKNSKLYIDAKIGKNTVKVKTDYSSSALATRAVWAQTALSMLEDMGDMVFDMLAETSTQYPTADITVKMLGTMESGNVKFQIKANEIVDNFTNTSTVVVEYKNNKLQTMKIDAIAKNASLNFYAERITSISYPNLAYFG